MKMYVKANVAEDMLKTVWSGTTTLRRHGYHFSFSWKKDDKQFNGIVCHGATNGTMAYKNAFVTIEELANVLEQEGLNGNFYLISCFPAAKKHNKVVSRNKKVVILNTLSFCEKETISRVKIYANIATIETYAKH